jgi:hypothetical protein
MAKVRMMLHASAFAPWGSPSMTAFASESAEATAPLNVGEATLTMSRRDPPGSY